MYGNNQTTDLEARGFRFKSCLSHYTHHISVHESLSYLKLMGIYCKGTRYLMGKSRLLEKLFFLCYSSLPHLTHPFIFLSFARVAFSAALFMRWNVAALLLPIIANGYCALTWVRDYSKLFVSIILFNHHNNL